MPTGKPNFNLNSYGVKYLSKDELQEFLQKREGEKIGVGSEPETVTSSRQKPVSKRPTRDIDPKTGFGQARELIGSSDHGKTPAEGRKLSEKLPEKAKPTKDTKTYFRNPDFVTQKIRRLPKPDDDGTKPSTAPRAQQERLGGETKAEHKQIEAKHKVPPAKTPKRTGEGAGGEQGQTGVKKLPPQLGHAPKELQHKKEKIDSRNLRVGEGKETHDEFRKREGIGEAPPPAKITVGGKRVDNTEANQAKLQAEEARKRKIRGIESKITEAKHRESIDRLSSPKAKKIKKKADSVIFKAISIKLDLLKTLK